MTHVIDETAVKNRCIRPFSIFIYILPIRKIIPPCKCSGKCHSGFGGGVKCDMLWFASGFPSGSDVPLHCLRDRKRCMKNLQITLNIAWNVQ